MTNTENLTFANVDADNSVIKHERDLRNREKIVQTAGGQYSI